MLKKETVPKRCSENLATFPDDRVHLLPREEAIDQGVLAQFYETE